MDRVMGTKQACKEMHVERREMGNGPQRRNGICWDWTMQKHLDGNNLGMRLSESYWNSDDRFMMDGKKGGKTHLILRRALGGLQCTNTMIQRACIGQAQSRNLAGINLNLGEGGTKFGAEEKNAGHHFPGHHKDYP